MISITISTTSSRNEYIVAPTSILRDVCKENNLNVQGSVPYIDGIPCGAEAMGRSLEQLGVTDGAFVSFVVKTSNA